MPAEVCQAAFVGRDITRCETDQVLSTRLGTEDK